MAKLIKKAAPVVDNEAVETAEETQAEPKAPRKTIMNLARELFTNDLTIDAQAFIEAVKEEFPDSAVNKSHYAWYRNKFRKEGIKIPLMAEKIAKASKAKKLSKTSGNPVARSRVK